MIKLFLFPVLVITLMIGCNDKETQEEIVSSSPQAANEVRKNNHP